tara:strand:- start:575 stop:772 length:198 start_codon:yes stop_codon:yes gene_type:complete
VIIHALSFIAQLAEHSAVNRKVRGSTPLEGVFGELAHWQSTRLALRGVGGSIPLFSFLKNYFIKN